ncbi:MAG: TetR/AcrR family transcriptional regulator [Lachnospiraceae bacterium]|nr:TetR/AcrR family transcriptional regulator [Lachnospiraceae bacterium]
MGKVEQNKQEKFENLLESAQQLFLTKGLLQTSINDITCKAGVAKGTFYLYFKDKYSIRDYLVIRWSRRLFASAHNALAKRKDITGFEDKLIFITDYIVLELEKNKPLLKFVSKNLSWGLFRQLVMEDMLEDNISGKDLFDNLARECKVELKDPEIMVFIIVEMVNSTAYSAIMESELITLESLMPYLNASIRAIIKNHVIVEQGDGAAVPL